MAVGGPPQGPQPGHNAVHGIRQGRQVPAQQLRQLPGQMADQVVVAGCKQALRCCCGQAGTAVRAGSQCLHRLPASASAASVPCPGHKCRCGHAQPSVSPASSPGACHHCQPLQTTPDLGQAGCCPAQASPAGLGPRRAPWAGALRGPGCCRSKHTAPRSGCHLLPARACCWSAHSKMQLPADNPA